MNNYFKFIFIVFCSQLISISCFSQYDSPYDDENFVFSVKQIDEFIERFNRDKNTFLITYMNRKFPGDSAENIDRKTYVINLFNRENIQWDTTVVRDFVNQVTDTAQPAYLDFYDYEWYALLQCKVLYKKRQRNLELVLKTERAQNNSSKWVIVSAKADFLKFKPGYDSTKAPVPVYYGTDFRDPEPENQYFINPVAHGTDFMSIDEAFDKKAEFKNYLYAGQISPQLIL